jgi:hypothetical protein
MSWFTDLLPKKANTATSSSDEDKLQAKKNLEKLHLYISVDFSSVKFLGIDENVTPHKILVWKSSGVTVSSVV